MAVIAALVGLLGAAAAVGYFVDAAFAASAPPAPSITSYPSNPSTSTSASFTFTDSQSGVSFKCSLDSSSFSTCTSGITYTPLAEASHTFKVEAVSGTTTSSATPYTWSVVPPTPTITSTSEPTNPTTATSASFKYSDTLLGVTFECSLDSSSYSTCASSGITYTLSSSGSHTFSVKAQSGSATSAAAIYTWTVKTPAPSIVSEPANPVASSSATFTYSDSQSGVSFKCSLDSASFASCASSGVTYSGLSDGSHTFSVEAELGSGPVSSATSYPWRVDTTPPTINVSFPANMGVYNAAAWAAGCSPVGICGTASDLSGVASVSVAIYQWWTGAYWNGSSFSSSSMVFNAATGTTSWHYPFALPPGNIYTLYVRATDTLGNTTSNSNLYEAVFAVVNPGKPAVIAEYSGSPQSATVHSAFGSPLVAQVTDAMGNDVPNVSVTFTAPTSGASGSFATCSGGNPSANECVVTTNSGGLATSSTFTANTVAGGPYSVAATTSGVSGSANFSLTNNPATASQIVFTTGAVSGSASQSATLGPVTVQVEDTYDNAVNVSSNTTVNLSSSSAGGIFATTSGSSAITSVTIGSGSSSASFYYGDSNAGSPKLTAASGSLTAATQTESISKASPTLSATGPANDPAGTAISAGSIGSALGGSSGTNATGTITFYEDGPVSSAPASCTSTGWYSIGTTSVSGNNTYHPSGGFTPTVVGDYWWYMSYNGDANNNSAHSTCPSVYETVVSKASPTLTAGGPGTGTANTVIATGSISSALAGSSGTNASGTITFYEDGPVSSAPASCTSTGWNSLGTASVSGNNTYHPSGGFTPSVTGNYYWYSSYGGDANNNSAHSTCPSVYETVVSKASPTLTAGGPGTGTANTVIATGSISSVLASSSGTNASGTITFKVFGPLSSPPSVCTTGGSTVGTASVSGNATYHPSAGYTPTASGNYYWYSSYGGDGNNNTAVSPCGSSMSVTVVSGSTATKLAFTTSPVSGAVSNNASLGPITVTVENASSSPVNVTSATTVTLSSNSTGTYILGSLGATSPGQTTVTIASGSSSVTFYYGDTLAGTPTIKAASGSLTPATQQETITAGTASVISIVSGSNQSANQGVAFANPLVALVADSFGNPVSGATVTFTAPTSGASGTFASGGCTTNSPTTTCAVSTGGNGEATSSTFTANSTGGSYNVSAKAAGTITVNFSLLNGMNFTITGPTGLPPVYPGGTSVSLDLSITNPNSESINVPVNSLGGSVSSIDNPDADGSLPACSTSWFTITPSSSTDILSVGAGATVSLSSLSQSDWPVLTMLNEPVNQDNCEGTTLNLSFTGTGSGS